MRFKSIYIYFIIIIITNHPMYTQVILLLRPALLGADDDDSDDQLQKDKINSNRIKSFDQQSRAERRKNTN